MASDVQHSAERADTTPVDGLLAAAREVLGMELAYLAELEDAQLVLREIDGDTTTYGGVAPGFTLPREYSWCHAMVAGDAAQLVKDAADSAEAADHPFVKATGIRAYAGVPVRRADGTVFGTLCCLSRQPQPDLGERDLRYLDVLARMAADRIAAAEGAQERRRAEVESAAGQALLAALNARENYTAAHSEAVLALALDVAAELGLDENASTSVGQVALLHDIGKVGVPDAILQKPGRLTAPEWEVMREHPAIGAQIVGAIGSLSHLAPAVRAEHERWDGSGYPDGLAGDSVPLASRICLVCDAWHAMTSDRPYRRALTPEQARTELKRHAGTQFCPDTVAALERVLDRGGAPPAEPGETSSASSALPRVRPDRPLEAELRALITISSAVAGAYRFEEVLDVVAAEACARCAPLRLDQPLGQHARLHADARQPRRAQPRRGCASRRRDVGADRARPQAGRRRALRGRARPRRAAVRGARVPGAAGAARRWPRRSASRAGLGCARGVLGRGRAAVHRVAPALRRGLVRPGRDGDRPRGAVLPPRVARLPGPAHAAAEPARARRAAGGGGRPRAGGGTATSRCCSATSTGSRTSTTATATTPATARSPPRGAALVGGGGGVPRLLHQPARRRRVLRPDGGPRRRRRARARARRRRSGSRRRRTGRSTLSLRRRLPRRRAPPRRPTSSAPPTPRSTRPSGSAAASCSWPSPGSRRPRSRRPSRGRGGASAMPGRDEREALVRFVLELLDGDLRGAGELARLEAVAGRVRRGVRRRALGDLAPRGRAARRSRPCWAPSGATATTRTRPTSASRSQDESYALADYPLTAP